MQQFEVIQGGKVDHEFVEPKTAPSGPKGPDWLRNLGYGARFVCRRKDQPNSVYLQQFGIAFVLDECILLAEDMGGMGLKLTWCISQHFSQMHVLVALLPETPDIEAGKDNGHNLSRSGDSEDHDGHEGSR